MHDKKLYGTATVGTKGQVVIPADARLAMGIETGDRLFVLGSQKGKWIGLVPEEQLREILDHLTENITSYSEILNNKHPNGE